MLFEELLKIKKLGSFLP